MTIPNEKVTYHKQITHPLRHSTTTCTTTQHEQFDGIGKTICWRTTKKTDKSLKRCPTRWLLLCPFDDVQKSRSCQTNNALSSHLGQFLGDQCSIYLTPLSPKLTTRVLLTAEHTGQSKKLNERIICIIFGGKTVEPPSCYW